VNDGSYAGFLRRFMDQHITFFMEPLPAEELKYKIGCCLATTNWDAIKAEIRYYYLREELQKQIDKLFKKLMDFHFEYQCDDDTSYSSSRNRSAVNSKWRELGEMASEIRSSFLAKGC